MVRYSTTLSLLRAGSDPLTYIQVQLVIKIHLRRAVDRRYSCFQLYMCVCMYRCVLKRWGGATFSPTCTLYKPVLIIKLYFTISQTWTVYQLQGRRSTFFALPKVSPVSTFCENCKSVNLIE